MFKVSLCVSDRARGATERKRESPSRAATREEASRWFGGSPRLRAGVLTPGSPGILRVLTRIPRWSTDTGVSPSAFRPGQVQCRPGASGLCPPHAGGVPGPPSRAWPGRHGTVDQRGPAQLPAAPSAARGSIPRPFSFRLPSVKGMSSANFKNWESHRKFRLFSFFKETLEVRLHGTLVRHVGMNNGCRPGPAVPGPPHSDTLTQTTTSI